MLDFDHNTPAPEEEEFGPVGRISEPIPQPHPSARPSYLRSRPRIEPRSTTQSSTTAAEAIAWAQIFGFAVWVAKTEDLTAERPQIMQLIEWVEQDGNRPHVLYFEYPDGLRAEVWLGVSKEMRRRFPDFYRIVEEWVKEPTDHRGGTWQWKFYTVPEYLRPINEGWSLAGMLGSMAFTACEAVAA